MSDLGIARQPGMGPRHLHALAIAALVAAVLMAALLGLALGPVGLSLGQIAGALAGSGDPVADAILWEIRLPRIVLGIATGAALAGAGAALQGLLRNPLADPGLVGVTAGASVGAVMAIVLGTALPLWLLPYALPLSAFVGAAIVIALIMLVARSAGETSVTALILAGVALQSVAFAIVGTLIFVSDDKQLRDFTFWSMGGLGGANWTLTLVASLTALAMVPVFISQARALDLLQLGERAAFHAGLGVEAAKLRLALATALAVGAVTAAAGPIGFVGLVAPHLVRLALGPSHRLLLPAAMLTGACLVLLADLAVRLAVPPAEPPIGLATSLIGGPFFLWLILRQGGRFGDA